MHEIKICYSDINNMGDRLNRDLIEKVFNCKVIRAPHYKADLIAIGSGLGTYLYGDNTLDNFKKRIMNLYKNNVYVWGTGFINYSKQNEKFYKKNIKILALRGELTKKRVEKILGKKLEVPTADGGLLASYFIGKIPEKKYDIGIIAHFREKSDNLFSTLLNKFNNSVLIDVQDTPQNVTKKIAECKCILSSSLHGLIISDSLHIPNAHIVATNKLMGDGYKFDDYYSCYGLKHHFYSANDINSLTINKIIKGYIVNRTMVEEKKKQLISAFPKEYKGDNDEHH